MPSYKIAKVLNCTVLEMNKGVTQMTFTPEQGKYRSFFKEAYFNALGGCLSAVSNYTSDVDIRQSISQMLREVRFNSAKK